jgi:hypothetical protein
MKKQVAFLLLTGLLIAHLFMAQADGQTHVDAHPQSTRDKIALGAYIQDAPTDPTAIDNFARLTGRMPAIVMWYQTWGESKPGFPVQLANVVRLHGATPLLTWEPWRGDINGCAYKLRNIARGDFDRYIHNWAIQAKRWGYPFYLRFAQEMNGNWYPWGVGPRNPNDNTPADYVAAWRHVHTIFTQVGVTNAIWVWSPNVLSLNSPDPTPAYPGDAYVDWIGFDGYNTGKVWAGSRWQSLLDVFDSSYNLLTSLSSKPLMISEMGSTEVGGDKADWITHGLLADLPTHLPRVRAVIWFDKNKETDWRINSSPTALAAYRKVVASPLYHGELPITLVDNLDNWSKTYSHTDDLHFDTNNIQYFDADASRVKRSTPTPGEIVWYQPHINQFQLDTYFDPSRTVSPFELYLSRDGINWERAHPHIVTSHGGALWAKYTYILDMTMRGTTTQNGDSGG